MAEDALRTMAARRVELERVLTEAKLIGGTRRPMEEVTQLKVARAVLATGSSSSVCRTELMRESKGIKKNGKQTFRFRVGIATHGTGPRSVLHPSSVVRERDLPDREQLFLVFDEKIPRTPPPSKDTEGGAKKAPLNAFMQQNLLRPVTLVTPLALALFGETLGIESTLGATHPCCLVGPSGVALACARYTFAHFCSLAHCCALRRDLAHTSATPLGLARRQLLLTFAHFPARSDWPLQPHGGERDASSADGAGFHSGAADWWRACHCGASPGRYLNAASHANKRTIE
eukprot:1194360-Prorocentrum_minimum.AAC.8